MDKQLLKAYIRTIVEEEVKRILPELLSEAVREVKKATSINEAAPAQQKPKIDRGRLAELMGISYDRENATITANTSNMLTTVDAAGNRVQVPASSVPPEVVNAITKDYSQLMKKMKLT
jgi:hypothetical protein